MEKGLKEAIPFSQIAKRRENKKRNFNITGVRFRQVSFSATALFSLLTLLTVAPLSLDTENSEAAIGTAKNSTLTMSVTNPTAEMSLKVASQDGTFASSSSSVSFNIKTDNYSGYTLSIQGKDDNGLLSDRKKQNNFTSISSAISEATFKAAANKTYNNQWGYNQTS